MCCLLDYEQFRNLGHFTSKVKPITSRELTLTLLVLNIDEMIL